LPALVWAPLQGRVVARLLDRLAHYLAPEQAVRQYDLQRRTYNSLAYAGRIGHKYHDAIAVYVLGLGTGLDLGTLLEETLDLRHPFLYRPLVEFALRLRPEWVARPQARKWVLREAMRGIVPDRVLTRIGKGSPAEVYASAVITRKTLLEPLVQEPILADLGLADAAQLRTAFATAAQQPHKGHEWHAMLHCTLAVEAWLQLRSGRWPRGRYPTNVARSTLTQFPR